MTTRKNMYLTARKIEQITNGEWHNLSGDLRFHGIRVNIKRIEDGDLCITSNPAQWGRNIPDTEQALGEIFLKGARAAIITDSSLTTTCDMPLLVVANTRSTLEKLALFVRDHLNLKRVLITGTEGKTGFKGKLHFLLNKQTSAHANLDSSNLTVPILCSMASAGENDEIEIIEASVAQKNVGSIRSKLVRPDICVITEVGFEHIKTHGSLENMIKNKASIIDGLRENGVVVLNADSQNHDRLREALYRRKYVDIFTYGTSKKCDARLVNCEYDQDKLLWNINAEIGNHRVSYDLPIINSHAPVASLGPLLVLKLLGFNVEQAASDYMDFKSSETMGRLSEISSKSKRFYFYDHSHRASILSYHSALKDLALLKPGPGGRKIAVLGQMMNIGARSVKAHEELCGLINDAGIDRLYTVGRHILPLHEKLVDKSILIAHGSNPKEVEELILSDIQDGDLVFIKGHHRIWLKELALKVYDLGSCHEIR